jgi:leucyl-tRNA synthetase
VVATALADARVQAAIASKKIRRMYVVAGRLVNLVT